ncbi:hypothetical protein SAMN02745166_04372 [Prosthecobacter debontii]|uniref:Uncharacterized protein n=1 Tax=Prosthecobacter debontii TaxID=48467 RepID=A0A1T4YXE7_9BACT|nr:hypothetical protein SAMN02745166_04372 [Prosthecobacter debontii]
MNRDSFMLMNTYRFFSTRILVDCDDGFHTMIFKIVTQGVTIDLPPSNGPRQISNW